MAGLAAPVGSTRGARAMVATADQIASQAGMAAFHHGGNAVDAAIAASAAVAVTSPHLCGMGGDLFVLVHTGRSVVALNASGRAGSGANAAALRAAGRTEMPFRHDIRSVTVPGCVDGWLSLHERFGSIPLADVLAPAIRIAEHGFPASPLLVGSLATVDDAARANLHEIASQAGQLGALVHRPGVGRTLRAIATSGRTGFYGGEFAAGLLDLGRGYF
ncbi:MAG: gamma-glutamyltransferase, partial [Ilumatobacteraceae bacterium]